LVAGLAELIILENPEAGYRTISSLGMAAPGSLRDNYHPNTEKSFENSAQPHKAKASVLCIVRWR